MRTFAQMIARIKATDEELMAAIVEAAGYTLHQYHANNRKVDGAGNNLAAQVLAAVPVWLNKPMSGWMQQGKRDPSRDMDYWQDVAAAKITGFFREQSEKRAKTREKRSAKSKQAAKPAQPTENQEVVETITCDAALVLFDRTIELTEDEARALAQYLVGTLRRPALKAA